MLFPAEPPFMWRPRQLRHGVLAGKIGSRNCFRVLLSAARRQGSDKRTEMGTSFSTLLLTCSEASPTEDRQKTQLNERFIHTHISAVRRQIRDLVAQKAIVS